MTFLALKLRINNTDQRKKIDNTGRDKTYQGHPGTDKGQSETNQGQPETDHV